MMAKKNTPVNYVFQEKKLMSCASLWVLPTTFGWLMMIYVDCGYRISALPNSPVAPTKIDEGLTVPIGLSVFMPVTRRPVFCDFAMFCVVYISHYSCDEVPNLPSLNQTNGDLWFIPLIYDVFLHIPRLLGWIPYFAVGQNPGALLLPK